MSIDPKVGHESAVLTVPSGQLVIIEPAKSSSGGEPRILRFDGVSWVRESAQGKPHTTKDKK